MIRVQAWNEFVSLKFYGPLAIWPWLKISPHSSLNVIYCLIITAWQWLMSFMYKPCIPMQIKPNKSPVRNRLLALLLWELATFPPQADHVLVDLFSSVPFSAGKAPLPSAQHRKAWFECDNCLFSVYSALKAPHSKVRLNDTRSQNRCKWSTSGVKNLFTLCPNEKHSKSNTSHSTNSGLSLARKVWAARKEQAHTL